MGSYLRCTGYIPYAFLQTKWLELSLSPLILFVRLADVHCYPDSITIVSWACMFPACMP